MTDLDIEVLVAEEKPKKKRGGRRPGAGRPSLVRENIERAKQGLPPIENPSKKKIYKRKSNAILPEKRKARSQEILAEMLGRKSVGIVQKVLDKAMDDDDPDQMACLKLVMDRVLPADYLAKASNKSNGITIQIMGVDAKVAPLETIEAEYEDVDG
jgi:hypothetical protein